MTSLPKLHQIDLIEGNGKVVKIIETVAAKWEKVATRLYFGHDIIDRIKRDDHFQSEPCCHKMFCEWLSGKGRQPLNWQTLITALKEAGFSQLASDLRQLISGIQVQNNCNSSLLVLLPLLLCFLIILYLLIINVA